MTHLLSHLTVLQAASHKYPFAIAFQIARGTPSTPESISWEPISYQRFQQDVEIAARYWSHKLSADGAIPRDVVGLWLTGLHYNDVVTIYGVSRAGYVPQLLSLRLTCLKVVFDLLRAAGARALVIDPAYSLDAAENVLSLPIHRSLAVQSMDEDSLAPLAPLPVPDSRDETVMIFHTSGSTAGSPKLVLCSAAWIDSVVFKSHEACAPVDPNRQDVGTWIGSMCHIAQNFVLVGSMGHGSCVIQPMELAFGASELMMMVTHCRLNRLHMFATALSGHIRNSRSDKNLLACLKQLDTLMYTGLPLAVEEQRFAYEAKMKLLNIFGSTECNGMLISRRSGPGAHILRPLAGVEYRFQHIESGDAKECLQELVVCKSSPDCPSPALGRNPSSGDFHTGDLFTETESGHYIFRGRADDWIKTCNGLRCDAGAIEENILSACKGLVSACVVVGWGRPNPAVFVEPDGNTDMTNDDLRNVIVSRTRDFHVRRYMHERIDSPEFVVVVQPGRLPRTATKGNLQRKMVELEYKELLDEVYGVH